MKNQESKNSVQDEQFSENVENKDVGNDVPSETSFSDKENPVKPIVQQETLSENTKEFTEAVTKEESPEEKLEESSKPDIKEDVSVSPTKNTEEPSTKENSPDENMEDSAKPVIQEDMVEELSAKPSIDDKSPAKNAEDSAKPAIQENAEAELSEKPVIDDKSADKNIEDPAKPAVQEDALNEAPKKPKKRAKLVFKSGSSDNILPETKRSLVDPDNSDDKSEDKIKYDLLSREDLVKMLQELLEPGNLSEIKERVSLIKSAFYTKYREETGLLKAKFIEEGGLAEEFDPPEDPAETEFKSLLQKYRDLRFENEKLLGDEKDVNLRRKQEVIDDIKDLVNRDESINKTFQEFRDLQRQWHEIGVVPQKELKNLWQNYHHHVEKFYDYIKINKELRDLDLKKNHEIKIGFCEKAEALLLEPNVLEAFKILQTLHNQWREIGPVPLDKRSETWDRFSNATSKINKKHQQYYQDLKESQRKNYESKLLICEKAEEISVQEITEHEQWAKRTRELLELQKLWKTIGFAPKKENNLIYARFRTACDSFFNKKRKFYAQNMEVQQNSLQQKMELCQRAESLQESTDWKEATAEFIKLQQEWKKTGPVPRRQSDELWKKFRTACDRFFNRKSEFFSSIGSSYEKNLEEKLKLINEISVFKPTDNLKLNLKSLNDFQRRWSEIGFVPIEKKEEITQEYRIALNKQYDLLEMDDNRKNMLKFGNKVDTIKQKPHSETKLRFEREKLMNRLQQMKNDIGVWENNIGFFASSKNAEALVKDFEIKIESAKEKIKLFEDKIIFLDKQDPDQ